MKTNCTYSLFLVALVAALSLHLVAADPPVPVFPTNYHAKGVLSLPYAELDEPFESWYDAKLDRSRTDYFGDLYKVYQFGPKSAIDPDHKHGSVYKLTYVPASFHQEVDKPKVMDRLRQAIDATIHRHDNRKMEDLEGKTKTKRVCFGLHGVESYSVSAQTVVPDLSNFKFDSEQKCHHKSSTFAAKKCELWKLTTFVGDKKNTYKIWVHRNKETGVVSPVYYYMLGYDTLLGSHYDRYDVTYSQFTPNAANSTNFELDAKKLKCGRMPGPGDDATPGEQRSHMIVSNPIHEYVAEPHRHDHIDHEFDKFAQNHGMEYDNEHLKRKGWKNFLHNLRFINSNNRKTKHYKLAVNKFADKDMNDLAYLRGRLMSKGYNGGLSYENHHKLKGANGEMMTELPESLNWELLGAVTPVKDQAVCGSCWSFGTSGTIEGAYFVKTGKLPRLSQQQMVDCSWQYGNNGCDGGEDFRAYKYIMDAGGLSTEEDYGSYMGIDAKCHDDDVKKSVKISGFYNVTSRDPEALKHAIATYGPVTVAIDASVPTFSFYSHGLFYDENCKNGNDELDHQVLAVGYTKVNGQLAWIVKNSWSTHWGNNGYILMSAENNNCGVMDVPTVPIINV